MTPAEVAAGVRAFAERRCAVAPVLQAELARVADRIAADRGPLCDHRWISLGTVYRPVWWCRRCEETTGIRPHGRRRRIWSETVLYPWGER